MKIKYLLLLLVLFVQIVFAQNKLSYQIFNKNGHKTSYKKLLKATQKTDVVLFGEYHENSVVHWLELELAKDLYERTPLILGAEMFEADNQAQLNQYLKGEINHEKLDSTARLWKNYKTDYKPLVDFAKEKNIPFIATNIPHRYASLVYKNGFEALEKLPDKDKSWMAPLPIVYDAGLPGYLKMSKKIDGHGGENVPKAQAAKDATMAYFMMKNLKENSVFVHYNGTYHSDNFEGIYWYLKQLKSDLNIITIATVTQKDVSTLAIENFHKADFILVVDEDVSRSY
jgi:uncharacterized iron-regulated protein